MIVLTKTVKAGRDHLIHRKRSPFPYEGKALTRLNVGVTYNIRLRGNASLAAVWEAHSPRGAANTFPYEGKGDRLRWMRSAIAKSAR